MRRVNLPVAFALTTIFLCNISASSAQAALVVVLKEAQYSGHTYQLVASDDGGRITWSDAESYAVSVGGHLATVNDGAENAFIHETFGPRALAQPRPAGAGNVSLWLGLNDEAQEGNFVWSSGETSTYRNWYGTEPGNGTDEDFIGMFASSGQWHDIVPDYRFFDTTYGVVEINAVPEPTSIAFAAVSAAAGWTYHRRRKRASSSSPRKTGSA